MLGFQRRIAGGFRVDLHLDICDVRNGIDRKPVEIVDTECGKSEYNSKDQPALADRESNDALKHGCLLMVVAGAGLFNVGFDEEGIGADIFSAGI